ncbi:MAG: hypothetical protein ACPK85_09240 [Methanosarcina sp.]
MKNKFYMVTENDSHCGYERQICIDQRFGTLLFEFVEIQNNISVLVKYKYQWQSPEGNLLK